MGLKTYNDFQWVPQMNAWGAEKTPFFFMVAFDPQLAWMCPIDSVDENQLKFHFHKKMGEPSVQPSKLNLNPKIIDPKKYQTSFNQVMQAIRHGDSFLCNLTVEVPIQLDIPLEELYDIAKAKHKLWVKDQLLVFSPETFVDISDNQIFTYPMKGTINAEIPHAKNQLLQNEKEKAEHYTIVDLMRNDLSQVAHQVKVNRFRYAEKIKTTRHTIWQTSSEIQGTLAENWKENIGDIFHKLLPAGSISGAPKDKTVEIIRSAETHSRGFYTGVFGKFDGEKVESAVMIRFIEQKAPQEFVYKTGGGITFLSIFEDEYDELKQKIYVPVF